MTESECISSLFSPNNKGRRGNACELAEETPSREAVDGPLSAYSISEEDENSGRPAAGTAGRSEPFADAHLGKSVFPLPVRSLRPSSCQ